MDDRNERGTLKKINQTLNHISETQDKILDVLSKPERLVKRFWRILGEVIAVLGVVGIIETIRLWITGG